ncbi:MAG: PHP domain-containing protein [Deltaproteobacteria bacterium]|nr:PHP domain-containing protein [Deltaproteobacteria bacterium]
MKRVDLHTHSLASDGTFSPSDLVRLARASGLAALGLCDHDTVEGTAEFRRAGRELNFPVIAGTELSVEFHKTTHLLGLDLAGSGEQEPALADLQKFRDERNRRLHRKLEELGLTFSWADLLEISGSGQLGRPHFARALIKAGYCRTIQEAFDRFLARGRPAYVPKIRPTPREALELLRKAGFAPVLAHPVSLKLPWDRWPEILPEWVDNGLAGLEVYHPDHGPGEIRFFSRLAAEFGLIVTAGSDYHGANKRTPLTWVKDHSPVGPEVLEKLKSKFLGRP